MELIKCEKCGEYYSDTYRRCPFCQEDEAIRRGKPIHRRSKDFRNKRGGHALGVMALLMAIIFAGAGVYHFFGDNLAAMLGIREPISSSGSSDTSQIDTTLPPDNDNSSSTQDPDIGQTDTPPAGGSTDGGNTGTDVEPPVDPDPVQRPETPVALSSQDFTLSGAGEKHTLTVAGGSGTYTWSTKNGNVASVSADGTVTAVGGGNTEVSVTDGFTTATCIVRVSGPAYVPPTTDSGSSNNGTLKLNREDMTMVIGETFQLKVSGTSSPVTWSIADSSVATISGNGTVKCLSKGTTTATAKVDGQTLKCIVRGK